MDRGRTTVHVTGAGLHAFELGMAVTVKYIAPARAMGEADKLDQRDRDLDVPRLVYKPDPVDSLSKVTHLRFSRG